MIIPSWALLMIAETVRDYDVPYPPFVWRQSKINRTSSGHTLWDRTQVLVTAGKDLQDQKMVVLHELTHWITIHRHHKTSRKGRGHTVEFWGIAFDLYVKHDLAEYAWSRERKYAKARTEYIRRFPGPLPGTIAAVEIAIAERQRELIMSKSKTEPERYLSRPEVAERIGVKPDTLNRYKLPEPDGYVGQLPGWLPETIDAWNAARPGPGFRSDLHEPRPLLHSQTKTGKSRVTEPTETGS